MRDIQSETILRTAIPYKRENVQKMNPEVFSIKSMFYKSLQVV